MINPGTVVDGRYEIIGPLGAGGMGQVYRARRPLLGDEVAIKVLHGSYDERSEPRERFLRESRASAQLRHPNIVTVLDFNVDAAGQPYLVMELLSGPSLRDELDVKGPMDPREAVQTLLPIANALQMAHDRGISHRDLKPANIVWHRYESGERVAKVIDFGLATLKETTDATRLTAAMMFVGTVAYASPEQLRGEPTDTRTDIYALGVIAYELLTGQRPFQGDTPAALMHQALTTEPIHPGQLRPTLSADVDRVILRALAKAPAERWPSAVEFVRALQNALGAPTEVAPSPQDQLLARYELGPVLGRGRLGSVVYRGTHRALDLPVAIRVLRRDEQPNWDAVKSRFLIEARTLQVAHPNVLQVRDYGDDERSVFVVTDFIEGPSLRDELAGGVAMVWSRVAALLEQMLDATMAINSRSGFVVGVNPDMIRLGRDANGERAVMSSAGIRSVQDVLSTMREQELRGKEASEQELSYVAPEVLLGGAPAPPADVFTIGVLGYQMATARLPFQAPNLPELIGKMLQTRPADLRAFNPDVPEAASAWLMRCLSSNPVERPTASELRALLSRD